MKTLAITLELLARMAFFTTVMALAVRSYREERRLARARAARLEHVHKPSAIQRLDIL